MTSDIYDLLGVLIDADHVDAVLDFYAQRGDLDSAVAALTTRFPVKFRQKFYSDRFGRTLAELAYTDSSVFLGFDSDDQRWRLDDDFDFNTVLGSWADVVRYFIDESDVKV